MVVRRWAAPQRRVKVRSSCSAPGDRKKIDARGGFGHNPEKYLLPRRPARRRRRFIYHPGMRPGRHGCLGGDRPPRWSAWRARAAAHAQPPPPGTLCAFTLSPPQVVKALDGLVTATLTPAGCAGPFRPYASVACVQLKARQGRNARRPGARTSRRCSWPYRPGATYISTGRGLGTLFSDMSEPNWQVLGPFSATL